MRLLQALVAKGSGSVYVGNRRFVSDGKWSFMPGRLGVRLSPSTTACSSPGNMAYTSTSMIDSSVQPGRFEKESSDKMVALEEKLERVIYGCRFMTFLGVWGSLVGSILCFLKGCTYVVDAFHKYFAASGSSGKMIMMLVEAIYIYLIGTVMLVFGMGLYKLFISNLNIVGSQKYSHHHDTTSYGSNLFGLFKLLGRPQWLEIKSVNELKTKVGHVIVMVLLVGLFEKSKKVAITTTTDLLCFSFSVLLASGCLYLLSKLNKHESR